MKAKIEININAAKKELQEISDIEMTDAGVIHHLMMFAADDLFILDFDNDLRAVVNNDMTVEIPNDKMVEIRRRLRAYHDIEVADNIGAVHCMLNHACIELLLCDAEDLDIHVHNNF